MASVLFVVPIHGFRDEELVIPRRALSAAGFLTRIAAPRRTSLTGMRGTIVSADEHIEDVSDSLFDAVVVVGGTGAKDELWGNPVVHHVLQRALAEHRLVVGLGHGVMALAHAGLLTGKHATCYPSEEAIAELARHGAIRVPGDIVDEGAGGIGAALVGAAFLGAGAFAG